MAIYTKKGDRGTTSLYGENSPRKKSDRRIVAYGTVDELNSQLGLVSGFLTGRSSKLEPDIERIQQDLFEIASTLASPDLKGTQPLPFKIEMDRVRRLEKIVDELEGTLPTLANFIFPGGSKVGSLLHVARTVCRRAEREIVALSEKEKVDDVILIYINRLSDTLFMLARYANHLENKKEKIWKR